MKKISFLLPVLVCSLIALSSCTGTSANTSSSSTSSSTSSSQESSNDSVSSESSKSSDNSESSEESKEEEPVALKSGDTGTVEDFEITLDSSEILDEVVADYGSFVPEEGSKYLVATFTVKNVGKSSATIFPSFSTGKDIDALVVYDGEYEYSSSVLIAHKEDLHNASLNPLTSKSGIVAFEIPNEAAESDKPLVVQIGNNKTTLEFSLK